MKFISVLLIVYLFILLCPFNLLALAEINSKSVNKLTKTSTYNSNGQDDICFTKLKQIISKCDKLIKDNPKDVNAYIEKACAEIYLRDSQAAIADYNQVLAIDPNNYLAYNNIGL